MGRKRRDGTEDDHFDRHFELAPLAPPTFEQEWGHVAASFGLAGDPVTDGMCSIPLDTKELEHVEAKLAIALQLHRDGEVEAAWYHLSCAKAAVAYRNGLEEGRYKSSDRAGVTRIASAYGKLGSAKKKASNDEQREAFVVQLLAQHEVSPFKIQRQLKDAAAKFGPGGGKGENDDAWGLKLIKQTRLDDLYQSLSRRRKP